MVEAATPVFALLAMPARPPPELFTAGHPLLHLSRGEPGKSAAEDNAVIAARGTERTGRLRMVNGWLRVVGSWLLVVGGWSGELATGWVG